MLSMDFVTNVTRQNYSVYKRTIQNRIKPYLQQYTLEQQGGLMNEKKEATKCILKRKSFPFAIALQFLLISYVKFLDFILNVCHFFKFLLVLLLLHLDKKPPMVDLVYSMALLLTGDLFLFSHHVVGF